MPTPIVTKRKSLQFKAETTAGTAETSGFSAINAYDIDCKPDVGFEEARGQTGFGSVAGISTARACTVTFTFDVTYKSAAAPVWCDLLPGCGFVLSTGVYYPASVAPGGSGGHKTLTLVFSQDGRKQVVSGACGNIVFSAKAGGRIQAKVTMRGILETPSDAAMPALTLPSSETVARFAGTTEFTIAASTVTVDEIMLDPGADVQLIPSQNTASGYLHAVVTEMKPKGTMGIKATLNATYRPLLDMINNVSAAFAWTIGATGNGIKVAAPALRITGEDPKDVNGVLYDNASFTLFRSAAAGDDFLTIDPTA